MKKTVAIFALLALLLTFGAFAETLGGRFETKFYYMPIPEDWETDKEDLKSEKDHWELGFLYSPGKNDFVSVMAYLDYYDSWQDVSLWRTDRDYMSEYLKPLLDDYAEYSPEVKETVQAGKIPFIVLKLNDRGNIYYWAETMTNGYVLGFEFNAKFRVGSKYAYRSVTDEEYALFSQMLQSFTPIY